MDLTRRRLQQDQFARKQAQSYPAFHGMHTRTKIVCTIGPASNNPTVIADLVQAGAEIFRLNFSHGSQEQHLDVIRMIRNLSAELKRPLGIFGDLSGPKIRVGEIAGGSLELKPKDEITFTSEQGCDGSDGRFTITFLSLHEAVRPGEEVLLDDGAMRLVVRRVRRFDVVCEVLEGGLLKPRKGVNLPQTNLTIPSMTTKDREDLEFAIREGLDAVALSFVRRAEDLRTAKRAMDRVGARIPLIAKIEKSEAIGALEEIVAEADGVMVARGDLGVELPLEQIPAIQKRLIRIANSMSKPVITATQMLESMIRAPRPTRAEVTDVFNAVTDGTDAVMLSGETAAGLHPTACVEVMRRIVDQAENDMHYSVTPDDPWMDSAANADLAMARAAVQLSGQLELDAIIVPTTSGSTARRVSRYRPRCPILACGLAPERLGFCCFSWGVEPRPARPHFEHDPHAPDAPERIINESIEVFREANLLYPGMKVAVIAGVPADKPGVTNLLRVIALD
ncbi:MAG: pyruvate kinase [Candidatus Sumerlaeia bacterium]|nr:pyruvate kinase [Candidatus Sumerlaeia bacterium]